MEHNVPINQSSLLANIAFILLPLVLLIALIIIAVVIIRSARRRNARLAQLEDQVAALNQKNIEHVAKAIAQVLKQGA